MGASELETVSHPRIAPGRVEERRYQTTMVEGCLRENTLVILPTGLGKTVVALRVMAEMLSRGRVLILAPTKPLVDQHSRFFREMLVDTTVAVMTGTMPPEKRAGMFHGSDVIVSTPQCVSNDLETGRYTLDGFSLVIYDEAHRGVGNYSYVTVAGHCVRGIRCMGMTASPGSDTKRVEEVCNNLSLFRIDMRSDDDPDVSPYVFDTYVNRIEVNLPEDLTDVVRLLRFNLDRHVNELVGLRMMDRGRPPSTKHMLAVGAMLQSRLARGEKTAMVFRGLSLQSMCIKLLHAINLAETQGMSALRVYMEKLVEESRQQKGGRSAKEIVDSAEFQGAYGIVMRTRVEHPKVSRVMSLVSRLLNEDPSNKVIVFSQYRDTCEMLVSKLSSVQGARVGKLVGQSKGGLKQKEQVELLTRFRSGEFNVVVSTSVGEEGLDVSSTNAVIFYEPVPSEIRTIQRRGRTGRKNDGEVFVMIARGTLDEVFDRSSNDKEEAMREGLERLNREFRMSGRGRQSRLDGF